MHEFISVTTTVASEAEAERIARQLVERRLAACVQVRGPIRSTYRWNGKIENSVEWVCVAKTRGTLFQATAEAIRECHSYDLPEIVASPITAGTAAYLDWLAAETEGA